MNAKELEEIQRQLKDEDQYTRGEAILALQEEPDARALPLLDSVLFDKKTDYGRSVFAISALAQIGREAQVETEAIRILTRALENKEVLARTEEAEEDEDLRESVIMALGETMHPDALKPIWQFLNESTDEHKRNLAFLSLLKIKDNKAIQYLDKIISSTDDFDEHDRDDAVSVLGSLNHNDVLLLFTKALVNDPSEGVRDSAAKALQELQGIDWQQKDKFILEYLEKIMKSPEDIDEAVIIQAFMPPKEELAGNQYLLSDFLIGESLEKEPQMTALIAKLIVQSVGESPLVAAERVNNYQIANNIPANTLKLLRINIGGQTAFNPLLRDLQEQFQTPLKDIDQETRENWHRTIGYAQFGFLARMIMSIVVFLAGIILVGVSSWKLLFGQLQAEQLLGPGVSLLGGLGTMVLIVYSGPLKDIRESIDELATDSAAFIAFVHCATQISLAFSYHFLREQVPFEYVEKSNKLIRETLVETANVLNTESAGAGEEIIDKAVKQILTAVSPNKNDTLKE